MEVYDIIMLVVVVGATLFGAIKGFAWQLASIGSIVVSYLVAYNFREPFSKSIEAEPPWDQFLAMLILYVGTSLVIWVGFRMVSRSIDRLRLHEFDRQVGAIFGLAKGLLYCTLITLFAVTLLGDTVRQKIVASRSGRYISKALDRSEAIFPAEIHGVVQPYLEKFDQSINGGETEQPRLPIWASEGTGDGSLPNSFWDEAADVMPHQPLPLDAGQGYPQQPPPWQSSTAPSINSSPEDESLTPAAQQQSAPFQQAQQPPWRDYQR